jgi:hypothetical protein
VLQITSAPLLSLIARMITQSHTYPQANCYHLINSLNKEEYRKTFDQWIELTYTRMLEEALRTLLFTHLTKKERKIVYFQRASCCMLAEQISQGQAKQCMLLMIRNDCFL